MDELDDAPILREESDDDACKKKDAPKQVDPYDIGATETALNEAAKRVNAVWISFISLCVYIFIATFTVTPVMLFREASVKLPIFNAELPLKVYFVIAPVLIIALHAYLIVLIKALTKSLNGFLMTPPIKEDADKRFPYGRLDNSIILRALISQRLNALDGVDYASIVIFLLTMLIMPILLLLITQLIFLPYQDVWMTLAHRAFIIFDLIMCKWLVSPLRTPLRTPWPALAARLVAIALVFLAGGISVILAAFPGEWVYRKLNVDGPNFLTAALFEGPTDPVDYNHNGGVSPFSNRLILHDDPNLAETGGASSGGVSLSVRARNFRKAVFDRSNLARVDFSASHLDGASLKGTILEAAKFECTKPEGRVQQDDDYYSDFSGEQYCASLNGAELPDAKLAGASFKGAQLNSVDLRAAHLIGAGFELAEMSGADLRGADVENAAFRHAVLLGAKFNGAKGKAANFSDAVLTAANFENSAFIASNFNGAGLQGANLQGANLIAADFNNAHMQGVNLSGTILAAARLEGAYLQDAILDNSNIKGASFVSASLQGASLRCVTPFRTRIVIPIADLSQTVTNYPITECRGFDGRKDGYYSPDTWSYFYLHKYDLNDDHVKGGGATGYESHYYADYGCDLCQNIYNPEYIDSNLFEKLLGQLISDLSNEEAKSRVRVAFERLKPGERTKVEDESEKTFWSDWAKKTASQDSHDKALAARLEVMACVEDGAPYVARGLLQARRFDRLDENEEISEKQKNGVLARLRKASDGGDASCLGAKGLVIADFPKQAS